jgi:hypothetical protein
MREQALRESSGAPIPVREVEDETQKWGGSHQLEIDLATSCFLSSKLEKRHIELETCKFTTCAPKLSTWNRSKNRPQTWDRCYDFLNIFAEKFGEKIGVFDSKQS